ncbi:MAG: antitoxin VapB family protein [Candidatus Hodarchaeota archaeon]
MGSKTISLDEEVYRRLENEKIGDESFSDVVKRLIKPIRKKSLWEFAGIWNFTSEEWEMFQERVRSLEKEFDNMFG